MRLAPKLLSAGLVALSSSPSDAFQTAQLRGIPVVENNNGDGRCRDGEEYMQIKTARPLLWLDEYTITWRQLTDACRNPVVDGFEATGSYFKTADRGDQDEDGSPQLVIDMCAPYGYYELEIKIAEENIDNHDNSQDIQWQIDAASNENLAIAKWSGKAEMSQAPAQSTFLWPLKDEAGYQLENMWSGPKPQVCTETRKGDLTLEEPATKTDIVGGVSDFSIPGTFDEGCYDYLDNKDILTVIGAPSSGMTQQRCKERCQKKGYWYSATGNGKNCLCGDMPPTQKKALDYCDVPCPGDPRFSCGGKGNNWYLSIIRIIETPEPPDAVISRNVRSQSRKMQDNSCDSVGLCAMNCGNECEAVCDSLLLIYESESQCKSTGNAAGAIRDCRTRFGMPYTCCSCTGEPVPTCNNPDSFDATTCVGDSITMNVCEGKCNAETCCTNGPKALCSTFNPDMCSQNVLTSFACPGGTCDVHTCCEGGPKVLCNTFEADICSKNAVTSDECVEVDGLNPDRFRGGGCDVETCCKYGPKVFCDETTFDSDLCAEDILTSEECLGGCDAETCCEGGAKVICDETDTFDHNLCAGNMLHSFECSPLDGCDVETCCADGPKILCDTFGADLCLRSLLVEEECVGECDVATCCENGKPNCEGGPKVLCDTFDPDLCLGSLLVEEECVGECDVATCCVNGKPKPVVYSEMFFHRLATGDQCSGWSDFQQSLSPGSYTKITLRGSEDIVGKSCTGLQADTICNAIKLRKMGFNERIQVTCDGNVWHAGGCGSNFYEISINGRCTCNNTYAVRACCQNFAWGGVNGVAGDCYNVDQTIEVICE